MRDVDVADVAAIEEIAARQSEQVVNTLTTRIGALEQEVKDLATALRAATALVTTMIEGLSAPDTRPPVPPRPATIDAACNADPANGAQPVHAEVFGCPITQYVLPGSDPAQVWADMCAAIATEKAAAWQN